MLLQQFLSVGIFLFLAVITAGCSQDNERAAIPSPCNFSIDHQTSLESHAERVAFMDCVRLHFPESSNIKKLDVLLKQAGYSGGITSDKEFANYVLTHNTIANSKTQILVRLKDAELIQKIIIDSYCYSQQENSWLEITLEEQIHGHDKVSSFDRLSAFPTCMQ